MAYTAMSLKPTTTRFNYPRYSTSSAAPSRPTSSSGIEHAFHLHARDSAWLSLKIKSRAGPSKSHPLYFDRDSVEGSVDLNLVDHSTTIQRIVITVCPPQRHSHNSEQTCLDTRSGFDCWLGSITFPRDLKGLVVIFYGSPS